MARATNRLLWYRLPSALVSDAAITAARAPPRGALPRARRRRRGEQLAGHEQLGHPAPVGAVGHPPFGPVVAAQPVALGESLLVVPAPVTMTTSGTSGCLPDRGPCLLKRGNDPAAVLACLLPAAVLMLAVPLSSACWRRGCRSWLVSWSVLGAGGDAQEPAGPAEPGYALLGFAGVGGLPRSGGHVADDSGPPVLGVRPGAGELPGCGRRAAASSSPAPWAVRKSRAWSLVPVMAFMRVASSVDWPIVYFSVYTLRFLG